MKSNIDRELFCRLWEKHELDEIFFKLLYGWTFVDLRSFMIYLDHEREEVSIILKNSLDGDPVVINWYKPMHIGRSLNTTNIEDENRLDFILGELKKECEELMLVKGENNG